MSTLRHLHISDNDRGDELLMQVFEAETNPMITISPWRLIQYFNTMEDKIEELLNVELERMVLFVWEGKKKTDVFELQNEDIERIIRLFNHANNN